MSARSTLIRGVVSLVVLGLVTAALVSSPVGAAITKKKVKATATKVFKKLIGNATAGNALHAETADSLNGVRVLPIKHRSGDVTNQPVFDAGGLRLLVSCGSGDEELRAATTVAGGEISVFSDDPVAADGSASNLVHNLEDDFGPGDDFDLQDTATASDDRIYNLQYLGGDGAIVSANVITDDEAGADDCVVSGYAVVIA